MFTGLVTTVIIQIIPVFFNMLLNLNYYSQYPLPPADLHKIKMNKNSESEDVSDRESDEEVVFCA